MFLLTQGKWKKNGITSLYADCFLRYFDTIKTVAILTIPDFLKTLGNIQVLFKTTKEQNQKFSVSTGEHVAVFWNEAGKIKWYLGLVDYVYEDSSISVKSFCSGIQNKQTHMDSS